MDTLVYNTEKKKLIIPEYGRHIHQMIDQAVELKDKEKRNEMAKAIIGVMGNLNPHLRDVPDFQHKLWAQLFIMTDFHFQNFCQNNSLACSTTSPKKNVLRLCFSYFFDNLFLC